MPRLLVIADDLTGACEVGVQFAKQGIPTLVLTEMTGLTSLSADYQVVVVNTESRHLAPDEAAQRVSGVVAEGIEAGATHFYKKTDSSLRGNIGSELEALMKASSCRTLPFMPAFPKLKRATREGFHYIVEQLLHESAFASDPLEPIAESFIPSIIKKQTTVPTRVLGTAEVSISGPIRFADDTIHILDAVTDDDLQAAARALKRNDLVRVTAGSSGFAECLAQLLGFERKQFKPVYERGRMLVVNGSVNEMSLEQVAQALAHGFAPVTLSPEMLLVEDIAQSAKARQSIARIVQLSEEKKDTIVNSIEKSDDLNPYLDLGRQQGRNTKQVHQLIARNMGEIANRILARANFRLLTVFGGDTLLGIARACRWFGLLPQDEILPGVVISRVVGEIDAPLLITKAGGFGAVDFLLQLRIVLGSIE
jgi:uncharacterized protein YgbK (DUF1537 family)